MSYSVTISSVAENDLVVAFEWYEEIREGLGMRFEEDFAQVVIQLKENPLVYQQRYRNYRIGFMKVFPYGIHFRVLEQSVQILAVVHTSRKPRS